jgi:Protein of unknown function (DUF2934)
MTGTLDDRIREHAYHIWEASGRPPGRDEEFWQRACEMVAASGDQPSSGVQRRQQKQAQPPQLPRKSSRRKSPLAASGASAEAG